MSAAPAAGRATAIDTARALAVVGVVFSHSIDGLYNASLLSPVRRACACAPTLLCCRLRNLCPPGSGTVAKYRDVDMDQ